MWYFSWILGAGLAASFAILNGMWFEMREAARTESESESDTAADPDPPPKAEH